MVLAPFHDLLQLFPIAYLFKGHIFNGCTGDDHAVKFSVLQFIKGLVKGQQVFLRGVLGFVGREHHKLLC